jgi:UDP:flavonoid glycosyltransferase YjiC (YdhE family)
MRVALAADGTRGDVHPMLALGERFRRRGCDVLVCAPPNFRADTEARDLAFAPVGRDTREFMGECAGAVTGGGLRVFRETESFLRDGVAQQLERIPALVADADLIVGAGVQLGARIASDLHGIPYRYIAYCPALFPSPELTPAVVPVRPLPRWLNRPAWRFARFLFDRLMLKQINANLAGAGFAPVKSAVDYVLAERPLLAADAELAPAPSECAHAIEQIPCLHPLDGPPLPDKLRDFLGSGPRPVFLGFGSMTDPDPAATTRRLLAALSAAGLRAVISQGWAGLADGPLPEGIFATGPVAHSQLFPRVAAVVHHGGAGTTTTAARAGVPQIVIPHLLDQFYWASRVTRLGLGPPPVPRTRLTAERLAEALAAIADNDVLRDRTREVGERLRECARAATDPAELLLRG